MVLKYAFLVFSISSALLGILFIYNILCFIYKRYFSKNKTENEKIRIGKYKKKSILIGVFLIILIMFIKIYSRSVSFYEMAKLNKDIELNYISLKGNISGINSFKLNSEDSKNLINFLEEYRYKRTFDFKNIGGKVEFVYIESKYYKGIFFEVYESGYIRIPGYAVYRVDLKDKKEFYNDFKETIDSFN